MQNFDLNAFSKNRAIKVLDVGCGTGVFWKKNLSNLNNYNLDVVFTDLPGLMVEKKKKKIQKILKQTKYMKLQMLKI